MDLKDKIAGLESLVAMFGKCSYQEQLKLLALKTKPILQACLGDVQNFKNKRTTPEFKDFNTILLDFMNRLICDTRFLIEVPGNLNAIEYRVDYYGQILEHTEGMFASIATVTNYLINFLDETDLVVHILIVFRRLYNFFPKYRKNLQEPMLTIFVAVLKNYKRAAEAN